MTFNSLGTPGPGKRFMVKFWTWDYEERDPGAGDYFFEIRGGVIVRDRKAKVLTVTFSEEMATGWEYSENAGPAQFDIPSVSFVLTRTSDLSYCEE